eukprot:3020280-Alexandrium_andersonii.AAC.1
MMIVVLAICRYRHHAMVLTVTMVMAREPEWIHTRCPELSSGPFCAAVGAEANMATRNSPELPKA